MSLVVDFHRLAAQEARRAEAWYAARSPDAAARFRDAVTSAVERIAQGIGTHPLPTTRFQYVRVRRFPYRLIFFQMHADHARVIAVAHFRRRPGYWRRRE